MKSLIVIHRTGFGEKDLFLGVKAGKASVNHGHMDAGSFVLDFLGHRWVSDLSRQDYHSLEQTGMNLFSMTRDSARWTVFRLNQSSHNTLTGLKPGDTIDWHMMTRALAERTGKGYSLSSGGEKLKLEISSPQESERSARPADPPPEPHDHANPGFTKINLRAVAGANGEMVIRAVFQKRN